MGAANAPSLTITSLHRNEAGQFVLTWAAETNAFSNLHFTVESAPWPRSAFTALSAPISESASLSYTDRVMNSGPAAFYRVAEPPAYTALTQPGAFAIVASWQALDAGNTGGLIAQGYVGAVSDGRCLYFAPYRNNALNFHGNVLRFDARLPRRVPASLHGGSNM